MAKETIRRLQSSSISALFSPASIAIIGLSDRPATPGQTTLANLRRLGYTGAIYGVHPRNREVLDVPCFSSATELPEAPDAVAICVGSERASAALEDAGRAGAKAAVVFASGFGEIAGGDTLSHELTEIASRYGLVVAGPNCLGTFTVRTGTALYSSSLPDVLEPGNVALLSHSGSICIAMISSGRFRFSSIVSSGNEVVIDAADYIDYFVADASTHVIGLAIETVRRPREFARAVTAARSANKPIVCLKLGRSQEGAKAAAAHTGALVGPYEEFVSFCDRLGVTLVDDMDALQETLDIFSRAKRPIGGGLGILSLSGGENALIQDVADDLGIRFPQLSEQTKHRLAKVLPTFATISNPLDATGVAVFDGSLYEGALRALADDPGIGLVGVTLDCPTHLDEAHRRNYSRIAEDVSRVAGDIDTPVFFFQNLSSDMDPAVKNALGEVPGLQGTRPALTAARSLLDSATKGAFPVLLSKATNDEVRSVGNREPLDLDQIRARISIPEPRRIHQFW